MIRSYNKNCYYELFLIGGRRFHFIHADNQSGRTNWQPWQFRSKRQIVKGIFNIKHANTDSEEIIGNENLSLFLLQSFEWYECS